jgi:hypothetical protein
MDYREPTRVTGRQLHTDSRQVQTVMLCSCTVEDLGYSSTIFIYLPLVKNQKLISSRTRCFWKISYFRKKIAKKQGLFAQMTTARFELAPFRTTALTWRLRPLGHVAII